MMATSWNDFAKLSIKEWKQALDVWSKELSQEQRNLLQSQRSQIIDKSELINFCQEKIPLEEMERLLRSKEITIGASSSSTFQSNVGMNPSFQIEQLSKMTPEEFRAQAAYIRKNPNAYRASQPAMSGLTDAQIFETASQMELLASNPSAFQAMKVRVKNLSPEEKERLLQVPIPSGGILRQEAMEAANLSQDQVKYRADCMRRHPDMVRSSNPMMAFLSDEEIRAAADQLETLSHSNPNFMKDMSDYLANMAPEEMAQFQKSMGAAEGGGKKPPISSPSSSSSLSPSPPTPPLDHLLTLSEEQIEVLVKTFRSNPERTRQLLRAQGMSEEHITKQYEILSSMDEATLKSTLQTLLRVQRYLKPLLRVYEWVNPRTGGYGGILMGVVGVVIVGVLVVMVWRVVCRLWYVVVYQALGLFSSQSEGEEGRGGEILSASVSAVAQTVTLSSSSVSSGKSPFSLASDVEDEFEF
jgi:hypothetical protein